MFKNNLCLKLTCQLSYDAKKEMKPKVQVNISHLYFTRPLIKSVELFMLWSYF